MLLTTLRRPSQTLLGRPQADIPTLRIPRVASTDCLLPKRLRAFTRNVLPRETQIAETLVIEIGERRSLLRTLDPKMDPFRYATQCVPSADCMLRRRLGVLADQNIGHLSFHRVGGRSCHRLYRFDPLEAGPPPLLG
jgi:hypothetical protein